MYDPKNPEYCNCELPPAPPTCTTNIADNWSKSKSKCASGLVCDTMVNCSVCQSVSDEPQPSVGVHINLSDAGCEGSIENDEAKDMNDVSQIVTNKIRTTLKFMQERRRTKWVQEFSWLEDDLDRIIKSVKALPEDLQDFSLPMVLIGSDVEALYPSLNIDRVSQIVYEAILRSKVKRDNVDYM